MTRTLPESALRITLVADAATVVFGSVLAASHVNVEREREGGGAREDYKQGSFTKPINMYLFNRHCCLVILYKYYFLSHATPFFLCQKAGSFTIRTFHFFFGKGVVPFRVTNDTT